MKTMLRRVMCIASVLIVIGLHCAPAAALVEGYTDTSEFDPGGAYEGMNWDYLYSTNGGTAVAVGHFSLLTASHYYLANDTFTINGDVFEVIEQVAPPPDFGESLPPDMRLVRLRNTTDSDPLPDYYDLYMGTPLAGQEVVLVGTGQTGTAYASYYTMDSGSARAKRWGTNQYEVLTRKRIDGYDAGSEPDWSTMTFSTSFNINDTDYEVGLGTADSGCGAFAYDGDSWKLLGMGLYVSTTGIAGRYSTNNFAYLPNYALWLSQNAADAYPGDYNADGLVSGADYVTWADNFTWTGEPAGNPADGNRDGAVTGADYVVWANRFGQTDPHPPVDLFSQSAQAPASTANGVPEPITVVLLAAGALLGLKRR